MAVSKHVEEILETLRNYPLVSVTKEGEAIEVLITDPYPEESNRVIMLGNGKSITTDDLEFAEIVKGEAQIKILLGSYIFHLERTATK